MADHGCRVFGRAACKDNVCAVRVAVVVEVELLVKAAGITDGPPRLVEVGERRAVKSADDMVAFDFDAAFVSHFIKVGFAL